MIAIVDFIFAYQFGEQVIPIRFSPKLILILNPFLPETNFEMNPLSLSFLSLQVLLDELVTPAGDWNEATVTGTLQSYISHLKHGKFQFLEEAGKGEVALRAALCREVAGTTELLNRLYSISSDLSCPNAPCTLLLADLERALESKLHWLRQFFPSYFNWSMPIPHRMVNEEGKSCLARLQKVQDESGEDCKNGLEVIIEAIHEKWHSNGATDLSWRDWNYLCLLTGALKKQQSLLRPKKKLKKH